MADRNTRDDFGMCQACGHPNATDAGVCQACGAVACDVCGCWVEPLAMYQTDEGNAVCTECFIEDDLKTKGAASG